MSKENNSKAGFTLLEILLVVGIIAILAGIVILAINPSKQLGDTRNAQRRSDVLTILNAVYQYSIDNNGTIPSVIIATSTCSTIRPAVVIATSSATTTGAYVNLYNTLVTSSSTYLTAIPKDPLATSTSGYNILETDSGRITVCAPMAESGVTISVTR